MDVPTQDGNLEFRVEGVVRDAPSVGEGASGKKAQGQFTLIHFDVKNVGKAPQKFDGAAPKAVDAAGRQYPADTQAVTYMKRGKAFTTDIKPGATAQGTLVFDVPAGTKLTAVLLHESPSSVGLKVAL